MRKLHLATAHVSSGGTVYHAISGIEAALWDLAARSLEVPLWQLFGGRFPRPGAHLRRLQRPRGADQLQPDPRLAAAAWMEIPGDTLHDAAPEVHWAPAETAEVYTPDGPGIGAELDLDACRRFARPEEPFFNEPGPS